MCRQLISVDWQGYCYDCDFNQMLDLGIEKEQQKIQLKDYHPINDQNIPIVVITARLDKKAYNKVMEYNVEGYIKKPIQTKEVKDKIKLES